MSLYLTHFRRVISNQRQWMEITMPNSKEEAGNKRWSTSHLFFVSHTTKNILKSLLLLAGSQWHEFIRCLMTLSEDTFVWKCILDDVQWRPEWCESIPERVMVHNTFSIGHLWSIYAKAVLDLFTFFTWSLLFVGASVLQQTVVVCCYNFVSKLTMFCKSRNAKVM